MKQIVRVRVVVVHEQARVALVHKPSNRYARYVAFVVFGDFGNTHAFVRDRSVCIRGRTRGGRRARGFARSVSLRAPSSPTSPSPSATARASRTRPASAAAAIARASHSSSPRDASSAPSNAGPRKGAAGSIAAAAASSAASEPDVASADVIVRRPFRGADRGGCVSDTADRSCSLRGPNRARLARAAIRPRVLRAPRSGSTVGARRADAFRPFPNFGARKSLFRDESSRQKSLFPIGDVRRAGSFGSRAGGRARWATPRTPRRSWPAYSAT